MDWQLTIVIIVIIVAVAGFGVLMHYLSGIDKEQEPEQNIKQNNRFDKSNVPQQTSKPKFVVKYFPTRLDSIFKVLAFVVVIAGIIVVFTNEMKAIFKIITAASFTVAALGCYAIGKHFELMNTQGEMLDDIRRSLFDASNDGK